MGDDRMAETLRILIVEDSEDDCLILVDELRQQGFEPAWERVQTGPTMKEALERREWDVVLADFSMPKFDALRALQVLQESMLDIPFIVVSGTIGEDIAVQTMKAGAHDYLLKDKLTRLGEAIRREMRDARVRAERNLAEDDLRESKVYLSNIINAIADPVFVKDEHSKFVLVNNALCTLLGTTQDEIIGASGPDFFPADQMNHFQEVDREVLASGKEDVREEPLTAHDGDIRTIVTKKTRYVDSKGSSFIVGVIRDMTEAKQVQAQLAQSDRLSSMGMLAAGVAHEINNPLSYVLYSLESLTEDLPSLIRTVREFQAELESTDTGETSIRRAQVAQVTNPAMLEDILARFKDALGGTQRIREVVRGLGTFARVEKDQAVPVNLMHVIDVALNMSFNEIKYRARLVKDYGRNLPTVLASEGRLGQVFLNLIINATHAIDEGDFENNEIRLKTWSEGDSVYAQVKDTGSGIPPENMGKLFDTFFTTKKLGVGSGLGLAISKGIVEGYGGTIEVESEVGQGTCFTVRLPVQSQEPTDDDEVQMVAPETTTRGRILIVDDEDGIRRAMVRMLRGHETVQAASGADARQILESDQAFDLILCDMMMPDVSGMDLHRWLIDANPSLAKQLIFITGGAFTPRARDYLSQVDNLRLEKPFDVANFKKMVSDQITIVKCLKSP